MRWNKNSTENISQHSPAPTPSRAVYGLVFLNKEYILSLSLNFRFVLWLLSHACLLLYLVWALVPDSYLEVLINAIFGIGLIKGLCCSLLVWTSCPRNTGRWRSPSTSLSFSSHSCSSSTPASGC